MQELSLHLRQKPSKDFHTIRDLEFTHNGAIKSTKKTFSDCLVATNTKLINVRPQRRIARYSNVLHCSKKMTENGLNNLNPVRMIRMSRMRSGRLGQNNWKECIISACQGGPIQP